MWEIGRISYYPRLYNFFIIVNFLLLLFTIVLRITIKFILLYFNKQTKVVSKLITNSYIKFQFHLLKIIAVTRC